MEKCLTTQCIMPESKYTGVKIEYFEQAIQGD